MPEDAPETGASEEHQDSPGEPKSGAKSSNKPPADSFADGGDAAARERSWQSRYDQEAAKTRALESRLKALEDSRTPALSAEDVRAAARETALAAQELIDERNSLQAMYPQLAKVRKDLFSTSYVANQASAEAYRASVEDAAALLTDAFGSEREEIEKEIRSRYEERFGRILEPVREGETPPALSLDDLKGMTTGELDAIDSQYGAGTVERLLQEAASA